MTAMLKAFDIEQKHFIVQKRYRKKLLLNNGRFSFSMQWRARKTKKIILMFFARTYMR